MKCKGYDVEVKTVREWYCMYITVRYVKGCENLGTYFKDLGNGKCILGEDTMKSWVTDYKDLDLLYSLVTNLIQSYEELVRDEPITYIKLKDVYCIFGKKTVTVTLYGWIRLSEDNLPEVSHITVRDSEGVVDYETDPLPETWRELESSMEPTKRKVTIYNRFVNMDRY